MNLLLAIPFVCAVIAAASMGAFFQTGDWYQALSKPSWTPPNWLFPIAWTLLYIAMAVSAWRVATTPHTLAVAAIAFWAMQITLNAVWSPVVFGANRLDAGVIIILAMWVAILMTLILSLKVDRVAGLLLVPYLVWVTYASALNFSLWRLNPTPEAG